MIVSSHTASESRPSGTVELIGIGEMMISARPEDVLVTYSLGSCLGVVLYDGEVQVAGLIHCLLPLSRIDPAKAEANPSMFVDTGLIALMQAMMTAGASRRGMVAYLAGACCVLDDAGFFKIGKRNRDIGRLLLEKNSIPIVGERVGGTAPRTLCCRVADGRVIVREGRDEVVL